MLFAKYKYVLTASAGSVSANTDAMYGMIEQVIVMPLTSTNTYDVNFIDKEGDIIYQLLANVGPIFDTCGLPVGRDNAEKFTMALTNVGTNEKFKIILKVREKL